MWHWRDNSGTNLSFSTKENLKATIYSSGSVYVLPGQWFLQHLGENLSKSISYRCTSSLFEINKFGDLCLRAKKEFVGRISGSWKRVLYLSRESLLKQVSNKTFDMILTGASSNLRESYKCYCVVIIYSLPKFKFCIHQ